MSVSAPDSGERLCPICERLFRPESVAGSLLPFCGDRCRQVDLCRWFDGRYAIASPVTDPEVLEEIADQLERGEE